MASRSAVHRLRIDPTRFSLVAYGILSHSSWRTVRSSWTLPGIATRYHTWRSRRSQTCSMWDMSGEEAGHGRTGTCWGYINCVHILATWGRALSCCWVTSWRWTNGTAFSMPMVRSLMTCGICGISTSNKSLHVGVAFYCPQYKECLYNGHALLITPVHVIPVWWNNASYRVCHNFANLTHMYTKMYS